jgi:hypothetical protein
MNAIMRLSARIWSGEAEEREKVRDSQAGRAISHLFLKYEDFFYENLKPDTEIIFKNPETGSGVSRNRCLRISE